MSVTFKTLLKVLPIVINAKKPILLRARHGVGKSACVYDFAETLGLPVVERRASQMTEGDLLGLPKLDNNQTAWMPPDWLKTCCDTPVVLFIDEIDRATTEVRQGFFELCDSRKIAGQHLHDGTLIFAAVNGGEHGAQYQVGEMDPAELDRWTVYDLEPTCEDWLLWAKKTKKESKESNICSMVRVFIREHNKHLEHTTDFEPNKVYPSRRSWERLSQCFVKNPELIEEGKIHPLLASITESFVGQEAAVCLMDFVKNYRLVITAKDIIIDGKFNLLDDVDDINVYLELVEKINEAEYMNKKMTTKMINNMKKFFLLCPGEVAQKLMSGWDDLGPGMENLVKIHGDQDVQTYIQKMYGMDAFMAEEAAKPTT